MDHLKRYKTHTLLYVFIRHETYSDALEAAVLAPRPERKAILLIIENAPVRKVINKSGKRLRACLKDKK